MTRIEEIHARLAAAVADEPGAWVTLCEHVTDDIRFMLSEIDRLQAVIKEIEYKIPFMSDNLHTNSSLDEVWAILHKEARRNEQD